MKFPKLTGRLLIAVPGIAMFLIVLFKLPVIWGLFLFSALSLIAGYESIQMCSPKGINDVSGILIAFFCGVSSYFIAVDHVMQIPALILPGAAVATTVLYSSGPDHSRRRMAGSAGLASLYAMGFGLMGRLFMNLGPGVVLVMLAICWVGDSAAYFVGVSMGKNKLMPNVSPKKSWEGFFGGLAGSVVGSLGVGYFTDIPIVPLIVLGLAGGIAGVYGDLFESALKRDAGVKDSSNILLGHGGILDRFDSAVVVAPVALVILHLFRIIT
ncbi:MAG: phosphatidate cytidylyltransferase [Candidatus Fermentibacteria bacterium]|nr:phosphatidate cytidylyltransferase [Candidatus Fermentibacteria bacterium]